MTRDEALRIALQQIIEGFQKNPTSAAHTAYIGLNEIGGQLTNEAVIVVNVPHKFSLRSLEESNEPIVPPALQIGGHVIHTDVRQAPMPKDRRFWLDRLYPMNSIEALGRPTTHQRCQNCPIMGGSQIAPRGANWVGTLGCALVFKRPGAEELMYGALTNAHVTGMNAEGRLMCQPHGTAGEIGTIVRVVDLRFDQKTPNYIDAGLIDTYLKDGRFANGGKGLHTVWPKQIDIGAIRPDPAVAKLGDAVIKSGRTTGVSRAKIVGIEGSSFVGYDEGTALFQRQLIIQDQGEPFSAGGDSGSLILLEATMQPVGLLFAGGGNQTIANPIQFVLDWCGGRFYGVA